jgi:hypothetical protein
MTFEELKQEVEDAYKTSCPKNWRKGQFVFNYIHSQYGVARDVQYNKGVDCFYIDENIDKFIKASAEYLNNLTMTNIIEILKDCPKGTKLYSSLCGECKLHSVGDHIIEVLGPQLSLYHFFADGSYIRGGECLLFPSKENRDWKKFQRSFKNGDIISNGDYIAIFYKLGTPCHCTSTDIVYYHCYYSQKFCKFKAKLDFGIGNSTEFKYATEEEKQKLFDAIKANGYKWDEKTKSLIKLIKPKFKVGDRIRMKNSNEEYTIIEVNDYTCQYSNQYCSGSFGVLLQDNYELVPDKFDINTLKPFDKVLVRTDKKYQWQANIFSHIDKDLKGHCYKYVAANYSYPYIIPYEGNEHLLGTTDDCADFYKIW